MLSPTILYLALLPGFRNQVAIAFDSEGLSLMG